MAEIGSVINGKYRVIKKIGQGGMSKVYLAKSVEHYSWWAVKEVKKIADNKNSQVIAQSLLTEAKLIKNLTHPALPHIEDVIEEAETIYLVMEYIHGNPLSRILEEQGAQPQELVISWAMQLCSVLNYLHSQTPSIIYRDMKPSNIMLLPDGTIKLIDFGIAREYKEENTEDTVHLGTRGYAAPEQFGGNGQTDARTDIYCLGVTLYHLITGKNPSEPPYEIYPIRHWNRRLSVGFEQIIQKCTQRNPKDRYQCCADMMYALKYLKDVDQADLKKKKSRIRWMFIIACIGVLCGAAMLYGFISGGTYTLYAGLAFVLFSVGAVVYGIAGHLPTIFQELYPKEKKEDEPGRLKECGETVLLSSDSPPANPSRESETELLLEETETGNLSEATGTTLLSEAGGPATFAEKEIAEAWEETNTIVQQTSILDLSVDEKLLKETDSQKENRKKAAGDFEIIEAVTLIHTKEEIA